MSPAPITLLLAAFLLFSPPPARAAEKDETSIAADSVEYNAEIRTYIARGSVRITSQGAVIQADRIDYDEETGEAVAEGNVRFDDDEASIQARRAELNLETKTGKLYDANVFYKKDHYRVTGTVLERKSEKHYYSPEATFTTCDAPIPDWCFKGRDVDVQVGDRLTTSGASFRVKDVPVLYAPYLWAPLSNERKTGFLLPTVSSSEKRGFGMSVPFYWAIAENRDATFVFDYYSKRGTGEGIEYRFVEPQNIRSSWWVYHLRDRELDANFWEIKGRHEHRFEGPIGGFLNVNYVNRKEFYREYTSQLSLSAQRYLESTGEFTVPLGNTRAYALAQYWVDLKQSSSEVAQRLPEVGYVVNYRPLGPFLVGFTGTANYYWREDEISAKRFDLYPNVMFSVGRDVVLTQTAAFRATGYDYTRSGQIIKDELMRTSFEYQAVGHVRLMKNYGSFVHVVEPSLGFHWITSSDNYLPFFDTAEAYNKTARLELSVLNRFLVQGRELVMLRLTQGYEALNGDRPFLPLKLELAVNAVMPLKLDATYDVHTGRLETINSDMSAQVGPVVLSFGQRYNRSQEIMLFNASLAVQPVKGLELRGGISYDAKGGGMREASLSARYQAQCWAVRVEGIKRPDDTSILGTIELAGINAKSPGAGDSASWHGTRDGSSAESGRAADETPAGGPSYFPETDR